MLLVILGEGEVRQGRFREDRNGRLNRLLLQGQVVAATCDTQQKIEKSSQEFLFSPGMVASLVGALSQAPKELAFNSL